MPAAPERKPDSSSAMIPRRWSSMETCWTRPARRVLPNLQGAIKGNDGYGMVAPVGRFKPNPWGLYDMHGNVAQLCHDWVGEMQRDGSKVVEDPTGPETGVCYIVRGAGWNHTAIFARSASVLAVMPKMKLVGIGFRVVCNAD